MRSNKKGLAELSAAAFFAFVFAIIAATPKLTFFAASNDPVRSPFLLTVSALIAYSQMPHVKHDFRVKKAQELCQQGYRGTSCEAISAMSDDEILSYIKDDIEVPQYPMMERLGG